MSHMKPKYESTLYGTCQWYLGTHLRAKGCAGSTWKKREIDLGQFLKWCSDAGWNKVDDLRQHQGWATGYLAYLRERGYKDTTIASKMDAVWQMLRAGDGTVYLGGFPLERPIRNWPKVTPNLRRVLATQPKLTEEEVQAVIQRIQLVDPSIAGVVRHIAYTGHRPSDVILLEWRHFVESTETVTFIQRKTREPVVCVLPEKAVQNIQHERTKQGRTLRNRIFWDERTNGPMSIDALRGRFKRAMIKLGLGDKAQLKAFRHAVVTQLISAGADRQQVMLVTGHRSESTLSRYHTPRPESVRQLLDERFS